MNKITTQSGKVIDAIGSDNSHVRTRSKFDITYEKVFTRILNDDSNHGYLRHSNLNDLDAICEDTGITNWKDRQMIIEAAYFYFRIMKEQNNDSIIN